MIGAKKHDVLLSYHFKNTFTLRGTKMKIWMNYDSHRYLWSGTSSGFPSMMHKIARNHRSDKNFSTRGLRYDLQLYGQLFFEAKKIDSIRQY